MDIQAPEPLYFARMHDGTRILLKNVERVDVSADARFILHPAIRSSEGWTVTEVSSGRRVSTAATREEALERARAHSSVQSGSPVGEGIGQAAGRFGLIPAHS